MRPCRSKLVGEPNGIGLRRLRLAVGHDHDDIVEIAEIAQVLLKQNDVGSILWKKASSRRPAHRTREATRSPIIASTIPCGELGRAPRRMRRSSRSTCLEPHRDRVRDQNNNASSQFGR
jgi:hypothetical protein